MFCAWGGQGDSTEQWASHGGVDRRLLQNAEWVEANFGGGEWGNIQRSRRLKIMASKMLECPEASLPQQNLEWSD